MTIATQAKALHPAQDRLKRIGGPILVSDWLDVAFIHYRVPPEKLQPQIPFELDLCGGSAWISLVAFSMRRLRLSVGGRMLEWVTGPIANHDFLNVRTYVVRNNEPGVFFLAEWVTNPLSSFLGPRTFGLPYRMGNLVYRLAENDSPRSLTVSTRGDDGILLFTLGEIDSTESKTALPANLDLSTEFLLDRYTAYTRQRQTERLFRIWHDAWNPTAIPVLRMRDDLLSTTGNWYEHATLEGAHYSAGVRDVEISRPVCLNGKYCNPGM